MHRGYIKLYRKVTDNPLYKERRVFSKFEAWVALLFDAQYADEERIHMLKMSTVTTKRGQLIKSQVTLAREWGWSRGKVQRYLKLLEKLGQIRAENMQETSRITLCDDDTYADVRAPDEQETSTKRALNEHQTSTKKKDKKGKKGKNTPALPVGFVRFWASYPKKRSKAAALKAWLANGCEDLADVIVKSVEAHCRCDDWKKESGRYVPYPATFLNVHGWEDVLTQKKGAPERPAYVPMWKRGDDE